MSQKRKEDLLNKIISSMKSALVAFSGGVDSTFLLKIARDRLGESVLAVTADSQTFPLAELAHAKKMARLLKVRHKIIKTGELNNREFCSNPVNRCYFCKKELFGELKKIAKKNKLDFVIDASNASDSKDFRPGSIAKKELGVRSPLQEAGLTKADIRSLSRKSGLPSWDKPSLACLASRIPYGTAISPQLLRRIGKAECFLNKLGFNQVRARHYGPLCRIEVDKKDIPRLLRKKDTVVERLRQLGYNYVTLDLEGFRSGSMNEVIKHE